MNKRQTGSAYETLAADWLKQHGYQITEKNYRCGQGEIDLIAEKDGYLVRKVIRLRRWIIENKKRFQKWQSIIAGKKGS